jgi:large subunit ribosomal protein L25
MKELKMSSRAGSKKSEAKQLRRQGQIPAIIYSQGKVGENIAVDCAEYNAIMRTVPAGGLGTTVFSLKGEKGKALRAIVKGIQYHVTTYNILHLDFEELHDDAPVTVKVPIECTGVADCVGIKLGGVLRQVVRHVQVTCLPKDMPTRFQLDVRDLNLRQSLRLDKLTIPENVKPVNKLTDIVVVITKR